MPCDDGRRLEDGYERAAALARERELLAHHRHVEEIMELMFAGRLSKAEAKRAYAEEKRRWEAKRNDPA